MAINVTSNCRYIIVYEDALSPVSLLKTDTTIDTDGADIVQITCIGIPNTYYFTQYTNISLESIFYSSATDIKDAIQLVIDDQCATLEYKTWKGLVTQDTQDDPVTTSLLTCEIDNDITWTRVSEGLFNGYSLGSFVNSLFDSSVKIIYSSVTDSSAINTIYYINRIDDDNIQIITQTRTLNLIIGSSVIYSDNLLEETLIEIKVFS